MSKVLLLFGVGVLLWHVQSAPTRQTAPAPVPLIDQRSSPETQYLSGDADAAVAALALTLPNDRESVLSSVLSVAGGGTGRSPLASEAATILLSTEVGMRKRTFGRYAASAPLRVAPRSIGLTGYFEVNSLRTYRAVETLLERARAANDSDFINFVRDWYVVVVSYCARWHLDCADALTAAAAADLDDSEIWLLRGSLAETRGARDTAEVLMRRALAAAPALVEARVRLGRLLMLRGRATESRQQITQALTEARASRQWFGTYFGELLLGQLDERAGRLTSARAHTAEAAKFPIPVSLDEPKTPASDPWALYRAAQFWQFSRRIEQMRRTFRQ